MITYVRLTPFPKCRYCGKQMDHYVPGMADKDHSHTECLTRHLVNRAMDAIAGDTAKD